MRSLFAAMLILAAPLSAVAQPRGHEGHGGGPAYGGARRPGGPGPAAPYHGPPPGAGGRLDFGAPGPGYGAPPPRYVTPQQHAREEVRSGRRVPLPMVIGRLSREMNAEYVATREDRDPQGRPRYVLRFRQRGRYIDVPVDAETGEVQR
jgi:hypothetical protein